MNIDRARELADNEAIENAFVITGEQDFVFDAQTWHEDCADYLIGSLEDNDYIRHQIACALGYLEPLGYQQSPRGKLLAAQCLNQYMANIGEMIIENAIKNGLTLEKVGV